MREQTRTFYNFNGKKLPKITIDYVDDNFSSSSDEAECEGEIMHESIESFYDDDDASTQNLFLNAII